ncbi:MAG: hypothetical protein IKC97_06975 [Clostridia bacterium]|nr:hypothetical protein [Clostridia bacterium]
MGPNALKKPARFFAFAIFWWLPKGVVASATFAQRNPKIPLLLQAGYRFLLHSAPRCKEHQEKNTYDFYASLDGSYHARRAVKVKEFALLTHLGRALMRPRWRSFARVQAPTALKSRREAGFQGVLDPLARFLGSFFAARQRMNTPSRYSSARGETAQYERPKEKLLKI